MRWPFTRRTRGRRRRPRRSRRTLPRWTPAAARVAAIGAALATLAWGTWSAVLSPALAVRRVEVAGNRRLPRAAVLAELERHLGEPLLLIDLDRVRDAIEANPAVARATVARRLPDLLAARVEERVAVARTRLGGERMLVDESGFLFPPGSGLPGDRDLPLLEGLATPPGSRTLAAADMPALVALEALVRVTGHAPPPGTRVDLTPRNRIVLRPGRDAPILWLNRDDPARNLEDLFAWKDRLAALRQGAAVDLRFASRLIVVPGTTGTRER